MFAAKRFAGVLCALTVGVARTALGQGGQSEEDIQEKALAALEQMQESLEKVRSGMYRAHGTIEGEWESPTPISINFSAYSAFDYARPAFRFDYSEESKSPLPEPPVRQRLRAFKYARTPEHLLHWHSWHKIDAGALTIREPSVRLRSGPHTPSFDIRSLALTTTIGTGEKKLSKVIDSIRRLSLDVVADLDDSLLMIVAPRYSTERKHALGNFCLWLDVRRGYLPIKVARTSHVRTNQLDKASDESQQDTFATYIFTSESETAWRRAGDVWVPASFRTMGRRLATNRETLTDPLVLSVDFTWESLNEVVSSNEFTWQDFDLPAEARITEVVGEERRISRGVVGDQ